MTTDITLATSADIRPDFSKSINSNEKKALVELMNNEFNSQRVAFDQQVRAKQKEALEQHRKAVGFSKLVGAIDAAKEEYESLREVKRIELENFKDKQRKERERLDQELEAFKKQQEDMLETTQAKMTRAEKKLQEKGFKENGDLIDVHGFYHGDLHLSRDTKMKIKQIEQELQDIKDAIYPAENQKNKYTALLWACSTYGEAMVIIREVLGNGVIPSIKKTDLPYNNRQLTGE